MLDGLFGWVGVWAIARVLVGWVVGWEVLFHYPPWKYCNYLFADLPHPVTSPPPRHPPRPRTSDKSTPLIREDSTNSGATASLLSTDNNDNICSDSSPGHSLKQTKVLDEQQEEDDVDGEEEGGDNDDNNDEGDDISGEDASADDNSNDDDDGNDEDGDDEEGVALIVALGGMGKCLVALQRCTRDIQVISDHHFFL